MRKDHGRKRIAIAGTPQPAMPRYWDHLNGAARISLRFTAQHAAHGYTVERISPRWPA